MQSRYFGRVVPGLAVCDIAGKKVGTIAHVHRHADAAIAAGHAGASAGDAGRMPHDDVIEVKTGLFGLGSPLYIPLSAIDDGLGDSIFLSKAKEDFERLGWYERPPTLEEHR